MRLKHLHAHRFASVFPWPQYHFMRIYEKGNSRFVAILLTKFVFKSTLTLKKNMYLLISMPLFTSDYPYFKWD